MPTSCCSLGVIDDNIKKRKKLTSYKRGMIVDACKLSAKIPQITEELKVPELTVKTTLYFNSVCNNSVSRPWLNVSKCYTDWDEHVILQFVQNNSKTKYTEIKRQCQLDILHSMIKRILWANDITTWRTKQRPALTPEVAAKRLAWVKEWKNWPAKQFYNIMWSDECSAKQGKGKEQQWCFGMLKQKWLPNFVQMYVKEKNIKAMVWGCFWLEGKQVWRSGLYIMNCDFESKKHEYFAHSYIKVLDNQLSTCWESGLIFMQDNALIHMSYAVRKWFEDIGIPLTDHPSYSSDLNLIEHIWWHLKNYVLQLHSELEDEGKGEKNLWVLEQALIEAWEAIPDQIFIECVKSMSKRMKAVLKAKGWHTKY